MAAALEEPGAHLGARGHQPAAPRADCGPSPCGRRPMALQPPGHASSHGLGHPVPSKGGLGLSPPTCGPGPCLPPRGSCLRPCEPTCPRPTAPTAHSATSSRRWTTSALPTRCPSECRQNGLLPRVLPGGTRLLLPRGLRCPGGVQVHPTPALRPGWEAATRDARDLFLVRPGTRGSRPAPLPSPSVTTSLHGPSVGLSSPPPDRAHPEGESLCGQNRPTQSLCFHPSRSERKNQRGREGCAAP